MRSEEEVRTPPGGAPVRAGERVGGGPGPLCGAARGRAQGRSRRGGAGVPGSARAVHVAPAAAVSRAELGARARGLRVAGGGGCVWGGDSR